jgi:plastocyanin
MRLILAFLLAAVCLALPGRPVAAAAQGGGTVEGVVRFRTHVQRIHHSADPYGNNPNDFTPPPEPLNTVVFLETARGQHFPPPVRHARLNQKNETFVPHVLPIMVGTVVDFYNSDPFYHNVFSLSPLKKFDLGRYPKGQSKSIHFGLLGSVRFDQPGVVPVFCEIHSHMSAYIVILTSPWFAVPKTNGRYVLDGIPPGRYTLRAWHDVLGERTAEITVPPGGATRCDITF